MIANTTVPAVRNSGQAGVRQATRVAAIIAPKIENTASVLVSA